MKRELEIGRTVNGQNFTLPLDFVTRTLAIIAIRGWGKTIAATVIAEEMCEAGLPWVAIDPVGVWWGLRANADVRRAFQPIGAARPARSPRKRRIQRVIARPQTGRPMIEAVSGKPPDLRGVDGMKQTPPKALQQIADVVLSYRPASKQPKPRKRKKAKRANRSRG